MKAQILASLPDLALNAGTIFTVYDTGHDHVKVTVDGKPYSLSTTDLEKVDIILEYGETAKLHLKGVPYPVYVRCTFHDGVKLSELIQHVANEHQKPVIGFTL